ncbi:hypothetical protein FDZ71_12865 [bacterium]|nr:MAG: hypothetical protein FDZ71_12865 [bacterium]
MNPEDEYNLLLARYRKAVEWFPTASEAEQDEMLPEFTRILRRLGELYSLLKAQGIQFDGIAIAKSKNGGPNQ